MNGQCREIEWMLRLEKSGRSGLGWSAVMQLVDQKITSVQEYLRDNQKPLLLHRDGQPPIWSDAGVHQAAFAADPGLYALLALQGAAHPVQRAAVLFQILHESRQGMDRDVRRTLERVSAVLLAALPIDLVMTVFLSLRRTRANHKHTMRAILTYLLNHPQMEDLVSLRRPAIIDSLEHAVGKSVARYCVRLLGEPENRYAWKHLL